MVLSKKKPMKVDSDGMVTNEVCEDILRDQHEEGLDNPLVKNEADMLCEKVKNMIDNGSLELASHAELVQMMVKMTSLTAGKKKAFQMNQVLRTKSKNELVTLLTMTVKQAQLQFSKQKK